MSRKQLWTGMAAFTGILILILDSKTALIGAQEGIMLCLGTVIPSLFPFFILSNLLTMTLYGMEFALLRPLGRIFGMPRGTESLLIPAFLGGYPAGAQSIAAACRSGQISSKTAEKMLSFCNNAGPAFLFGMIGPLFPHRKFVWALWLIQILSAWMVSLLFRPEESASVVRMRQSCSVTDAMYASLKIMAAVCGWIIVFRVLIGFLSRWFFWFLPRWMQTAMAGLLELSNGCLSLPSIRSVPVRFILCSVLLSFGGLCVTMQTLSAADGLSFKYYLAGKALQVCFSLILALSLRYPWTVSYLLVPSIPRIIEKIRKNSRNPRRIVV